MPEKPNRAHQAREGPNEDGDSVAQTLLVRACRGIAANVCVCVLAAWEGAKYPSRTYVRLGWR
jgi:hypothetical protein